MFEKFNVNKFSVSSSPVVSLYSSGRSTATVVDSGHETTTIVPIYEGMINAGAISRVKIAGKQVTEFLTKSLPEGHYNDGIKETLCYVAQDFATEQ